MECSGRQSGLPGTGIHYYWSVVDLDTIMSNKRAFAHMHANLNFDLLLCKFALRVNMFEFVSKRD